MLFFSIPYRLTNCSIQFHYKFNLLYQKRLKFHPPKQKRQPEHCPTAVNGNFLCVNLDLKAGFKLDHHHLIIDRDSLNESSDKSIRVFRDCLGLLIQEGGKIFDPILHILSHRCLRQYLLSFIPQLKGLSGRSPNTVHISEIPLFQASPASLLVVT